MFYLGNFLNQLFKSKFAKKLMMISFMQTRSRALSPESCFMFLTLSQIYIYKLIFFHISNGTMIISIRFSLYEKYRRVKHDGRNRDTVYYGTSKVGTSNCDSWKLDGLILCSPCWNPSSPFWRVGLKGIPTISNPPFRQPHRCCPP